MDKRPLIVVSICAVVLLVLGSLSNVVGYQTQNIEKQSLPTYRGNWLYVGGTGPGNYTRIQDAIDNASDGDTIFVFAGQYHERVNVTKIIHLLGEDKNRTIISHLGGWESPILSMYSNQILISNFTINVTNKSGICIFFGPISQCTISNNILQGDCGVIGTHYPCYFNEICYNTIYSKIGIELGMTHETSGNNIHHNHFVNSGIWIAGIRHKSTVNNTISDNYFENCSCKVMDTWSGASIYVVDANNTIIERNLIVADPTKSDTSGICLETMQSGSTGEHLVCDNIIKNCSGGGITTVVYGGDTITNNLIEHCGYGMSINENFVTIKNNTIRYCNVGQDLWFASPPSILEGNLYDHCTEGIEVWECMNTTFTRNTFSNNKLGVSCHLTYMTYHNYFIYNNFKGNRRDVYQELSRNRWLHNYWDEPRSLPKPIFGLLPFIQFDWQPAQQPYDIPGMI